MGYNEVKVKPLIYLSGRYQGCTEREASAWRKEAEKLLGAEHVCIPVRKAGYEGMTDDECVDLVNADLDMIDKCCAVLYNAWSPSWGSGCELHYAFTKGLVTVVFGEGAISPWLKAHATHYTSTLKEAVNWLKGRYDIDDIKETDIQWNKEDNRYVGEEQPKCKKYSQSIR